MSCWVPRSGTYFMKPTASCGAAQLWVRATPPPHIVPRRGTDASRMMFRMIVGPASRNQGMVMSAYPTAALLRSLQWVSDGYVSHRDTVLIDVSAMGGCVATAGRHSLLSLPRQLVNCSLSVSLPDNICISNAQYSSLSAQRNLWCEILEF